MNLSALPDLRAVNDPAGAAVADDYTDLDNTQFLDAVRRAAASLQGHGVCGGDVVAIMLPNTASFRGVALRGVAPRRGSNADQPLTHPGRGEAIRSPTPPPRC